MKIAGIMQPYFMPYFGYFSLIKHVDQFIVLDTVQHIRHGWVDRNRILKQNTGWLYIRPDLKKHSHGDQIGQIRIDNTSEWKQKILSQLVVYKSIAPNYWKIRNFMIDAFADEFEDLVHQNAHLLTKTCQYLGLDTKIEIFSEMSLKIDQPQAPDEWALEICKAIGGVTEYWNPPGGREFFDKNKYDRSNIALKFMLPNHVSYSQRNGEDFIPGLSIIDMMMFNSVAEVNIHLDRFDIA